MKNKAISFISGKLFEGDIVRFKELIALARNPEGTLAGTDFPDPGLSAAGGIGKVPNFEPEGVFRLIFIAHIYIRLSDMPGRNVTPLSKPPKLIEEVRIYADGASSGNPGPGGWGVVLCLFQSNQCIWLTELGGGEPQTTNNRMELKALLEALRWLKGHSELHSSRIRFYLDSQYVLKGMQEWVENWKKNGWKKKDGEAVLNRDIWEDLQKVREDLEGNLTHKIHKKIEWNWVKGHAGDFGNERADTLAVGFSKQDDGVIHSLHDGAWDGNADGFLSDFSAKKPYYLSVIGNEIHRDATWAECEKRVKGVRGARFKKISSSREEADCLLKWGVGNQTK